MEQASAFRTDAPNPNMKLLILCLLENSHSHVIPSTPYFLQTHSSIVYITLGNKPNQVANPVAKNDVQNLEL